mmetsp:Transcript_41135/g.92698  ORF Transcript_41135/g.92698 Transcript_41135/m.92698 type:complete len:269 (-) Transcript_41135:491-1297(-)
MGRLYPPTIGCLPPDAGILPRLRPCLPARRRQHKGVGSAIPQCAPQGGAAHPLLIPANFDGRHSCPSLVHCSLVAIGGIATDKLKLPAAQDEGRIAARLVPRYDSADIARAEVSLNALWHLLRSPHDQRRLHEDAAPITCRCALPTKQHLSTASPPLLECQASAVVLHAFSKPNIHSFDPHLQSVPIRQVLSRDSRALRGCNPRHVERRQPTRRSLRHTAMHKQRIAPLECHFGVLQVAPDKAFIAFNAVHVAIDHVLLRGFLTSQQR